MYGVLMSFYGKLEDYYQAGMPLKANPNDMKKNVSYILSYAKDFRTSVKPKLLKDMDKGLSDLERLCENILSKI